MQGESEQGGVQFSATDSLVITTNTESGDRGALYGQAQMSYRQASLSAYTIEMDFKSSVLRASGPPSDTATQGRPVFQRQGSGSGGGGSGRGATGLGGGAAGFGGGGGGQSFTGKALSFNLQTMRGRVVQARTQQRDGYIEGDALKVYEDSTLFAEGGSYTTCDCPPDQTPSYSLRTGKMKVKDRWIYTGPIQLYLFNIPTPLWLPFGFLPNIPGRRSGPLPPRYGQDRRKGLYLQDWGWYFALNDYIDLQLRASIWSKGSYEINPIFRYRKRYEYNGRLNFTYQRTRIGEAEDPVSTKVRRHSGELRWSHSQELSPTASLQGNVNLATSSDFARRNSTNYNDAVRQELSSNVRYSKSWPGGGKNLNVSVSQRQQIRSGEVSMTLPSLNFSQRSFKPFDFEQAVGEERWFEKITTSYDFSLDNNYSFRPRDPGELRSEAESLRLRGDSTRADSLEQVASSLEQRDVAWYEALVDRQKYQFATGQEEPFDLQVRHRVPVSASFRVNRYNLSLSPNLNYTSDWRISTERKFVERDTTTISEDSIRVEEETVRRSVPGFYARHDFSTGISANTELYGLFPLRIGAFQGLRHRMSPSISFRYAPNFNNPFWGRTRRLRYQNGDPVFDDRTGEPLRYDILDGRSVRGDNEQRSLSFSLDNELETKHVRVDSTGETVEEKIKLLDFDLNTSYNFAADSLRMSDIDLRARTTIRDFRINTSMTFSPYALRPQSFDRGETRRYTRTSRYMAADNPLTPIRLTRFRLSVGGSFRRQGQGRSTGVGQGQRSGQARQSRSGPPARARPGQGPPSQASASQPQTSTSSASRGYLDTNIPWSLNFDFSYSLRKPGKQVENQNATLNANFTLDVTPLWSLRGRTGYDLVQNKLATTSINVQRDLGCWTMSFRWVPFGDFQQYSFNLQVKSGQLSQLLQLQLPNSGRGSQLGGFGSRLRGTAGSFAGGRPGGRGGGGSLPF